MSKQQIQTLYAYTWHTTQKLLDHAALLDEADYHAHPGFGHGSIHDLLFHLLVTWRGWRIGLESGRQPPRLQAADYGSLQLIQEGFAREIEGWTALLERLSEEEINGPITLTTLRGDSAPFAYWRVLHHLLFHGMQHHTEIAQLLTNKGRSPGDIDFLFYAG